MWGGMRGAIILDGGGRWGERQEGGDGRGRVRGGEKKAKTGWHGPLDVSGCVNRRSTRVGGGEDQEVEGGRREAGEEREYITT